MKQPAIYIMANKLNGTIYIGVTSNLIQRAYLHKAKILKGFTSRYGCTTLVYYELFETMESAILREKQLKDRPRKEKLRLIGKENPDWNDLYPTLF
jgi:putative endonuclease